jgi:hypothetical protein
VLIAKARRMLKTIMAASDKRRANRLEFGILIYAKFGSYLTRIDGNSSSISGSIEAVCRKTLQDVNRDSGENPGSTKSVLVYVS